MSFDPDAGDKEHQVSEEDLLEQILRVLVKIEKHLSIITDEEVEEDVDQGSS